MTDLDVVFDNWEIFFDRLSRKDTEGYRRLMDYTTSTFDWASPEASESALLRLIR